MSNNWAEISEIRRLLKTAIRSEVQAIAIYRTEIFIRQIVFKSVPKSLLDTLPEEREHEKIMVRHLQDLVGTNAAVEIVRLQTVLGWITGTLMGLVFGFLPIRVLYAMHEQAEKKSAQIYLGAARVLDRRGFLVMRPSLAQHLEEAGAQEREHALLFGRLRRGEETDSFYQTGRG